MSECEAGRELDALVAEKVMGWRVSDLPLDKRAVYCGHPSGEIPVGPATVIPNYSTDISAAWEVLDRLSEEWDVEVTRFHGIAAIEGPMYWRVAIGELVDYDPSWIAKADTVPLAICLAALKAVEDK